MNTQNLAIKIWLAGLAMFVYGYSLIPLDPDPYWVYETNTSRLVAFGNINNDSYLDMAVTKEGESNIIFMNQAGNYPSAPSWYSNDVLPNFAIAFGDYNNDGWIDLAVGGPILVSSSVRVYDNEQGIMNPSPGWTAAGFGAMGVAWGDADNDGDLDLAAVDILQNPCVFYNNQGELETTPSWQGTDYDFGLSCTWVDMNNDGWLDLIVTNHVESYPDVRIYYNNNGYIENIASWRTGTDPAYTWGIATGDVDENGWFDIAIAKGYSAPWPNYLYLNYDGIIDSLPSWISDDTMSTMSVHFGDMNGDGYLDLLAANSSDHATSYENIGGILETEPSWISMSQGGGGIAICDVDNDGLIQCADTLYGDGMKKLFYLKNMPIQILDSIAINGNKVPVADYCYMRESGWFSFKNTPSAGDEIVAHYSHSVDMELAQTGGMFLYRNTNNPNVAEKKLKEPVQRLEFAISPNPATFITRIEYYCPVPNSVLNIKVYDVNGRLVKTFAALHQFQSEFNWAGEDMHGQKVSAGIYFVSLETKLGKATKSVVFLR